MVILALRFVCVSCGTCIEKPTALPVSALPAKIGSVDIPAPPEGWTLTPDGRMHCPEHTPRRVLPVSVMPRRN